jgi:hypothetical protein
MEVVCPVKALALCLYSAGDWLDKVYTSPTADFAVKPIDLNQMLSTRLNRSASRSRALGAGGNGLSWNEAIAP